MCQHCEDKANKPSGMSPYGSHVPSKIPRPQGGRSGEPVPKPGKPAQYPFYLKPIPVNTRNIEAELRKTIRANTPDIQKWLYSTWNAQADAIKYQEIRNAIRDAEVPAAWVESWRQSYADFIHNRLAPKWAKAQQAGGIYQQRAVKKSLGITVKFPETAKRLEDWVSHRAGELAVGLTDMQHAAVKDLILELGVREGMGPKEMARYLRPVIGLTPKQEAAVRNHRAALIAEGTPLEKVDHLAENYAGYLHRVRADRIAQTELSFAFNQGALEEMRQARDRGAIKDRIVKEWLFAGDERSCLFCEELDGQTAELDETFPAVGDLENIYAPPAHPFCRCTVIYSVMSAAGSPDVEDVDGEEAA